MSFLRDLLIKCHPDRNGGDHSRMEEYYKATNVSRSKHNVRRCPDCGNRIGATSFHCMIHSRSRFRKLLALLLLICASVHGQSFNLAWDKSPSAGVTNYVLYGHTNALSWTNLSSAPLKLSTGTNTQYQVDAMRDGRYWFTVTAVAGGIQSTNSNVLIVDIPKAPGLLYTVVLQYGATVGSATNNALFLRLLPLP